jgi:hypothetical protein
MAAFLCSPRSVERVELGDPWKANGPVLDKTDVEMHMACG